MYIAAHGEFVSLHKKYFNQRSAICLWPVRYKLLDLRNKFLQNLTKHLSLTRWTNLLENKDALFKHYCFFPQKHQNGYVCREGYACLVVLAQKASLLTKKTFLYAEIDSLQKLQEFVTKIIHLILYS